RRSVHAPPPRRFDSQPGRKDMTTTVLRTETSIPDPTIPQRPPGPVLEKGKGADRLASPVTEEDHRQGLDEAPVTLVEYGDYECPHCGRAHPIVKEAQRRLGNKLRFVFRNFPLAEKHPHAVRAAEAAEAAGGQGKFWEMHDRLLEHQEALTDVNLVQHAMALELDATLFQ